MFAKKSKSSVLIHNNKTKHEGGSKDSSLKCVRCCIKCELVSVCEKTRIVCPYCGSFFDPKMERDKGKQEEDTKHEHRRSSLVINKINKNCMKK